MSAFPLGFSGSYDPADVTFLLTPVVVDFVDVAAKEALIQSGRKHYSEMLAREKPPSPEYMAVFHQAFAANRDRVGRDVARLAKALAARGEDGEIVLVSLARAGTPIGVLLRRALVALGRMAVHYSVSIIRDRGIDPLAMAAILARHDPASIVFVDGWTGKGAIGGELARAMAGDFPIDRRAAMRLVGSGRRRHPRGGGRGLRHPLGDPQRHHLRADQPHGFVRRSYRAGELPWVHAP